MDHQPNHPSRAVHRVSKQGPMRAIAGAVLLSVAVTTVAAFGAPRTDAAAPTTNPVLAGQYGAHFLTTRVNAAGFVPTALDAPNYGLTLGTALALAQAGVEKPTFDRIIAWVQANVDATVKNGAADDNPGNLGYLLMVTRAAGLDATAFAGVDLVARLSATLGTFEAGLYGQADPTYDGVFRQSLAILGLVAAGGAVPVAASGWLESQQCGATPAASTGAFQSYRATPAVSACTVLAVAPDYIAPDTNSTALAIEALHALAIGSTNIAAAVDWLATQQTVDGGFGYQNSPDPDPNSTSLVIQGIVAAGEDPGAGRWNDAGKTPFTSLLTWQLGCKAAASDRGGFASPFSGGFPDDLATVQAVWGIGSKPFPPSTAVVFSPGVEPCVPATTTTTSTTTSVPGSTSSTSSSSTSTTSTVSTTSTTAIAPAIPATPVVVSPEFAG